MFTASLHLTRSSLRTSAPRLVGSSNLRQFTTTTTTSQKWEGRQPEENSSREPDTHNAQIDAVKEGKESRARGDGNESAATSEKDQGNANKKAKEDHPEAPGPVIGMNDERGGRDNE